jgi:hypothetical protein
MIQSSMLGARGFELLAAARPHLKPFIDLAILNGHVIEHYHRYASISAREMPLGEIQKLEAMIGAVHMGRQAAPSEDRTNVSIIDMCESVARIHMLW